MKNLWPYLFAKGRHMLQRLFVIKWKTKKLYILDDLLTKSKKYQIKYDQQGLEEE